MTRNYDLMSLAVQLVGQCFQHPSDSATNMTADDRLKAVIKAYQGMKAEINKD